MPIIPTFYNLNYIITNHNYMKFSTYIIYNLYILLNLKMFSHKKRHKALWQPFTFKIPCLITAGKDLYNISIYHHWLSWRINKLFSKFLINRKNLYIHNYLLIYSNFVKVNLFKIINIDDIVCFVLKTNDYGPTQSRSSI